MLWQIIWTVLSRDRFGCKVVDPQVGLKNQNKTVQSVDLGAVQGIIHSYGLPSVLITDKKPEEWLTDGWIFF